MYRSPEERREAGLGTELTDWLTFSGLIEFDKERSQDRFSNAVTFTDDERPSKDVQLGFAVEAFDWLEAEVIFEGERQKRYHSQIDEAYIGADFDGSGIKIGKQYVPFGEYFSHFVIGPMLEFGETRGKSLVADFSLQQNFELSAFAFKSRVNKIGKSHETNWGATLEWLSADESIRAGLSYLNDMAETQEPLLGKDTVTFERRVSGWNGYLLWGVNDFVEVTAEFVRTKRQFRELETPFNQPAAANLELAWMPTNSIQIALRVEHSWKLEDAPEWKTGFSLAWRPMQRVGISLDYLYANYRKNTMFDDDDNEARRGHQLGALVSFEF